MEPIAEVATGQVVSAVVEEAIAEVSGTSHRKWAVVFLAIVVGAAVAGVVMRQRRERFSTESEPQSAA
jgi:hypothetical protein